jgi:hypothetical protein
VSEHRQNEPAPFILNLVDPRKDPNLPLEERIDRDATMDMRRALVDKFGKQLPTMAQSVHEQFRPEIVAPSAEEVAEAESWKSMRTCQACRRFEYERGQEWLQNGGVEFLQRAFGGKAESSWLGDWRKYGWCDFRMGVVPCIAVAERCPEFAERNVRGFLRALGRHIKRIGDL